MSFVLGLALCAPTQLQEPLPPHTRSCEDVVLAVGAHVGLANTTSSAPEGGAVQAPSGWYSGDTHAHRQLCGKQAVTLTPAELYAQQQAAELDVASALIWHPATLDDLSVFFQTYAPLVTGLEESVSASDPSSILQHDLETSGFQGPSQFGHLIGLGLQDAQLDPDHSHSTLVLDFMLAQPGAISGYAHVLWPENYTYPPIELIGSDLAYFAPIDMALGKVDFLERVALGEVFLTWSFRGMHYPLLNAGMRFAITGGSDNSCLHPQPGDSRTWFQIGDEPLSYPAWTQAIAAGRTSIAVGASEHLQFVAGNQQVGSQLELDGPGDVPARATIFVAPGVASSGTIEVLRNGVVIASEPFDLPNGGEHVFPLLIPMSTSAWLAARVKDRTHTGSVYAIVDDRPIVRASDAFYWVGYCDHLATSVQNNQSTFLLDEADKPELLARIGEARRVYQAYGAVASIQAPGLQRYGKSSQACAGPIAIGATGPPIVGAPDFALTCLNAPPDSIGWVFLGTQGVPGGFQVGGITAFVDPFALGVVLPTTSQGAGYAERGLVLPPAASSLKLAAQFLWLNTPSCPGFGDLSASDALMIEAF